MNQHNATWTGPLTLASRGMFAPKGLILGERYTRLVRDNSDTHVICVAETGAGKTSSFVLPNLMYGWPASTVTLDPKGELYTISGPHRALWTRVKHLAPCSMASDCFNPLDAIRLGTDQEVRDAQLIGEMLSDPGKKGADHMSDTGSHFTDLASEGIGGIVLYGKYTQRATSLPALNELTATYAWPQLLQDMARYPHRAIRRAGRILEQIKGEGEASGIFSSLTKTLRIYTDPVLARCASRSDFTWHDLRIRAKPMSLYITVPFGDQERLRPWIRLIVRQMLDYVTSHTDGWQHRLLGMFDEFTSLGKMTILEKALTYTRGYGFRLALITPSIKEIRREYGHDHTFFETAHTKVAMGIADTDIAKEVSSWIGETTRYYGSGPHRYPRREPLFSATAVQHMHPRQMVIVSGRNRLLARQAYYKHIRF